MLDKHSENVQFNGIDLVKFICAYMVCIVHNTVFSSDWFSFGNYADMLLQQCFCRIAVPFYFTAAGFLLFRKINFNDPDVSRVRSYCFKVLRLLGTWIVLSFVGGTAQLWFLGALVVAVIILFFLLLKLRLRYVLLISLTLYFIGLLGDSYHSLLEPLNSISFFQKIITGYETYFENTRNGVFMGLIFVSIGALFANKQIKINPLLSFIGFVLSMGLLFGEYSIIKCYFEPKGFNMYVSLLPAVFFLFSFASGIKLKNNPIYKRLRTVGMLVFYLQFIISFFVLQVLEVLSNRLSINLVPGHFFIFVIVITTIAIIIERLSNNEKFNFLRYLYS